MDSTDQEKTQPQGGIDEEEDPLLSIARMRREEQEEIMRDQKKLQDMRMEHIKKVNELRKKGRK